MESPCRGERTYARWLGAATPMFNPQCSKRPNGPSCPLACGIGWLEPRLILHYAAAACLPLHRCTTWSWLWTEACPGRPHRPSSGCCANCMGSVARLTCRMLAWLSDAIPGISPAQTPGAICLRRTEVEDKLEEVEPGRTHLSGFYVRRGHEVTASGRRLSHIVLVRGGRDGGMAGEPLVHFAAAVASVTQTRLVGCAVAGTGHLPEAPSCCMPTKHPALHRPKPLPPNPPTPYPRPTRPLRSSKARPTSATHASTSSAPTWGVWSPSGCRSGSGSCSSAQLAGFAAGAPSCLSHPQPGKPRTEQSLTLSPPCHNNAGHGGGRVPPHQG